MSDVIIDKAKSVAIYKGKEYPLYLNRGNAASFIRDRVMQYLQGNGLDIGAGRYPVAKNATPIDISYNDGLHATNLTTIADDSMDFVFSSHCLEHLEEYEWEDALKLWIKKLKVGGYLILYLPHPSMELWHPGAPWVGSRHKWIPQFDEIMDFLTLHMMHIVQQDPGPDKYWSFHIVAQKTTKETFDSDHCG